MEQEIVLICHHGMRSMQAANFLTQVGFKDVSNLVGGIDAWSINIDSSVVRY
jgi:rhodanese-related sulfurtransferase